MSKNFKQRAPQIRINEMIRAPEVRVIGPEGENYDVLSIRDALNKANELGFDLIEISATANPPITKIMDYGKYLYDLKKKQKAQKAKTKVTEVKNIQIKTGTDENDLMIKAKKASEWLKEGHRIKLELFLPGRSKYLDRDFLKSRFDRILKLISEPYNIAEDPIKNPKGLYMIIEKKR